MNRRHLFVTTALPYANGPFHIGHIMEYIQADIWVRFQRMQGHTVHFIGADDAHGAPIMLAAEKAGKSPEVFIGEIAKGRKRYLDGFHIEHDNWHSTHSKENTQLSQDLYRRLKAKGLVYSKAIEQFYDPVKGMFLADRYIKGECPNCGAKDQYGDACENCSSVYSAAELKNPRSTLSGARPVPKSSEHHFFRLSDPKCKAFLRRWLNERRPQTILHPAPLPSGPTSPFPVLRLNALPIGRLPADARRLVEDHPVELAAAQRAIRSSRLRALIGRRATGELVGFGNDTELVEALGPLGVRVTSDLVSFGWDASVVDGADIGLALDALTLGLGRGGGLRHVLARRGHLVRVDDGGHPALDGLRRACDGPVVGIVPRTHLSWAEAVELTVERRNGVWWLLLTPEIWVAPRPDGPSLPGAGVDWRGWPAEQQQRAAEFVRERLATRYNRDTNRLLEAWVGLLARGGEPRTVRTWNLPEGSGVDPSFELHSVTAFSRPLAAWEPGQAHNQPQPETRR